MQTNPDFRCALAKQLNFRTRNSSECLDTDYYSAICDNQLSVGSPCKSPSDLLKKNVQTSKTNDCQTLVVANPVQSKIIGFNVDQTSFPCSSASNLSKLKSIESNNGLSLTHDTKNDLIHENNMSNCVSPVVPRVNRCVPFSFKDIRQELQSVISLKSKISKK